MSMSPLVPQLVCRNATDALAFYQQAFGAEALMVLHAPDERLMHACLAINGAHVFVCDGCGDGGPAPPEPFAGTPVTLHLNVPDCDAVFARAEAAGCRAVMPLEDMFWGDRYGVLVDPFGHSWAVATPVRQLSEDELRQAVAQACA